MTKFIIGRKIGMSQWWNEDKVVEAITLIDCSGLIVKGKRDLEKDNYRAIIVGALKKKNQQMTDFDRKTLNDQRIFALIQEFPLTTEEKFDLSEGHKISVETFESKDKVNVSGLNKGKGFQGVVKRHNFAGGPKSHGHRHVLRSAGSIGCAFPEHVQKGKKMAGRMGNAQTTVKNLRVAWLDKEKDLIAIKGAVPGRKGGWLKIVGIN